LQDEYTRQLKWVRSKALNDEEEEEEEEEAEQEEEEEEEQQSPKKKTRGTRGHVVIPAPGPKRGQKTKNESESEAEQVVTVKPRRPIPRTIPETPGKRKRGVPAAVTPRSLNPARIQATPRSTSKIANLVDGFNAIKAGAVSSDDEVEEYTPSKKSTAKPNPFSRIATATAPVNRKLAFEPKKGK
jgi:hypothetical protein